MKNWSRGENRRLLLNGLFSNSQCFHRYPRVNWETMAKNQSPAQDTGGLACPAEGVPLPHTPSQTHSHLLRLEARARPAGTQPPIAPTGREATSRAGHGQTARVKARLAAPSLAVHQPHRVHDQHQRLPRSKAAPEPAPRTLPRVSKPFLNARVSVPLSIFNFTVHSN